MMCQSDALGGSVHKGLLEEDSRAAGPGDDLLPGVGARDAQIEGRPAEAAQLPRGPKRVGHRLPTAPLVARIGCLLSAHLAFHIQAWRQIDARSPVVFRIP